MKVKGFIEKYKKSNGMQSVKVLAATKSYLPFTEKQALVDRILNKCIKVNNGYVQCDEMEKYIAFTCEIIMAYTNIKFDEDFSVAIKEYDALCESGVLNKVLETFEGEYNTVMDMLSMRQDYIMQSNSLEAQVSKFFNGLSHTIDMLVENISEQVGSFGLDDFGIDQNDIAELTEFIKTLGK